MSYDISLMIDTGGPGPVEVGEYWNYTSNCAQMWRAAGADLAEFDGKPTAECIPILAAAITELASNPDHYRHMDPPNGWGSYETLGPALERLLDDMKRHPKTIVRVSR